MRRFLLLVGCLGLLATQLWADPDQAGLPGYCSIGGEPIFVIEEGHKRPGPDYREIECRYSNGQLAKVAVCAHHADTFKRKDYPIIWAAIKRGWSNDMEHWSPARQAEYWKFYEGVTITSCEKP